MSDSQTQPFNPTPGAASSKRGPGVLLWLLVLLIAGGAVAGAVWYAGGTDALSQLGDMASSFVGGSFGGSGGQKPVVPAAASTNATGTSSLPPEARQRMFLEQAESKDALSALVEGRIVSLKTGAVRREETSATIAVTAGFKDGNKLSGLLSLKRFADTWYFFSLSPLASAETEEPFNPKGFDSGVVATITEQQALPGTQEMLTKGLLDGGYRVVKVDRVTPGPRTATVDVTMSGGTEPPSRGRFVCISKTDGATTYWFVARFEKR